MRDVIISRADAGMSSATSVEGCGRDPSIIVSGLRRFRDSGRWLSELLIESDG
jgi:hypothetical protein